MRTLYISIPFRPYNHSRMATGFACPGTPVPISVGTVVRMTFWALLFLGLVFACLTAGNVFDVGDRFEMPRIDTASNPTFVVQLVALRNWTDEMLVAYPVGSICCSPVSHVGVAVAIQSPSPNPTSTSRFKRNLFNNAFDKCFLVIAILIPVHVTPSSRIANGPHGVVSAVAAFINSTASHLNQKEIQHA